MYGAYVTGRVEYIIGAFAAIHIVQESIIAALRGPDKGVVQLLRGGEDNGEGKNEAEAN